MNLGASGYQSWIKSTLISGNYFGVYYTSGGSNLFIKNSAINSNSTGVLFYGSGILSGKCSDIKNNTSSGISMWEQSSLNFSNHSNMNFKSNGANNIKLNTVRNLYLDNGYNDFEPSNGNKSFIGLIEDNSPSLMGTNTIMADNNNWNSSAGSPISGTDYILKVPTLQPDTRYIVDNNPSIPDPQDCIEVVLEENYFKMSNKVNSSSFSNNYPIINTAYFTNRSIYDAILDVKAIQSNKFSSLSSLSQKNVQIIELYRQILTSPIDDNNSKVSYLQTFAFNEMKKIYGEMIDSGIVSNQKIDNYPFLNPTTLKLKEVMDTLALSKYNTGHTYQEKFYYSIEKALLYRGVGRIELADSILQNTKSFVIPSDSSYLDKLSCKISLEKDLIFGIIDYDTFLASLNNCTNTTKQLRQRNNSSINESSLTQRFKIYPNPSKGLINIESDLIYGNENINMRVYNSKGQLIYKTIYTIENQRLQSVIDLSNFSPGLYFLNVITNTHNCKLPQN